MKTNKNGQPQLTEYSLPLKLEPALGKMLKDHIYDIGKNLELSQLSTLNKQQLIDRLANEIPESIPFKLKWLQDEHYQLLNRLAERGGVIEFDLHIDPNIVQTLKGYGYLFIGLVNGTLSVVMAQEVIEAMNRVDYKQFMPILKRNTQLIKTTRGLLYYYGYLSTKDMEYYLKKYLGDEVNIDEVLNLIHRTIDGDDEIQVDPHGFSYFWVKNVEEVQREHAMRSTVDYYPFTMEQLIQAGEPEYVERNPSYDELLNYMRNTYDMNHEEASDIVEELMNEIRNGALPTELIALLEESIEFDDVMQIERLMDKLAPFYHNTKQWFLKGHTPEEMSELRGRKQDTGQQGADVISITTRTKVGRNDPCPCGSGKKFKKCCGG